MNNNLISINIARAIAAFSVFCYHQHIGKILSASTQIGIFDFIDELGATYAVPLFFLISGYCIHLSNLKYLKLIQGLPLKKYYKQRFLRIYPPYLLAVIVSIGINYIILDNFPSPTDLWVHLFCLQGFANQYFNSINLVLWTITIEAAFYIIYPIFYYLRLKYSLPIALSIAFLVSSLSITLLSVNQPIALNSFYWFGNLWFAWCCGAYIADKSFFEPRAFNMFSFKLTYIIIVVIYICLIYFPVTYLNIITYQFKIIIWTAPLIYLISKEEWLCKQQSFLLRIVAAIGLSSYSLYLLHQPLIILKNYLAHTYLPVSLQNAGMVVGFAIIPVLAWLNYTYIERWFITKRQIYIP